MNGNSDSAWYYMNAHYLLTGHYIWEAGYPSFTGPSQFFFPHGGYSLFLYVAQLLEDRVGVSWIVMLRIVQLGAYLASAALVYAIGRRLRCPWAGLAGMVCFFLYAPFLGYATTLLSETIFTCLLLAVIWLFLKGLLENKKALLCLCFFLGGYGVLLKPVLWPVIGLLAITMVACQWRARPVGLWLAALAFTAVCPLAQSMESKAVFGNYRIRAGSGLNLWNRVIACDKSFPEHSPQGQLIGDAQVYDFPVKRGKWWLAATYFSKFHEYSKEQTEEAITRIAWQGLLENKGRYAAQTAAQAWQLMLADELVPYSDLDPATPYGFRSPDQAEPQQLPLVKALNRQKDASGQGVLWGVPARLYWRFSDAFDRVQCVDIQIFIALGYLATLLAWAVGLCRRYDPARLAMLAVQLAPGLIIVGTCLAETPDPRFRLPAEPLLILVCCVGMCLLPAQVFSLTGRWLPEGASSRWRTACTCVAIVTLGLIVLAGCRFLLPDRSQSLFNDAEASNLRGFERLSSGDVAGALKYFNRAIEINPQFADAYNKRGAAFLNKEDPSQAVQNYSKAIELEPNFAAAYLNRGNARVNMGETDLAIGDYTKAIEFKPGLAMAHVGRGYAYLTKEDWSLASKDCTQAIELEPNIADAYYNRGIAFFYMGDANAAIADYTRAIELKPDYAKAYLNRGATLLSKGNCSQAIEDFTKGIEIQPNNASAYENRAIAYSTAREYDKAWADAKTCRKFGGTPNLGFIELLTKESGRSE